MKATGTDWEHIITKLLYLNHFSCTFSPINHQHLKLSDHFLVVSHASQCLLKDDVVDKTTLDKDKLTYPIDV